MELRVLLPIHNTSQLVNNSSKSRTQIRTRVQGLELPCSIVSPLFQVETIKLSVKSAKPESENKASNFEIQYDICGTEETPPRKPSLNTATSPLEKNHKTIKYYSDRWMKSNQVIFGRRQLEMLDISADHKTTTHKTRGNTQVFTHG